MTYNILNPDSVISDSLKTVFDLENYQKIMHTVKSNDFVATDDFRKIFNSYYKVRQRNSEWYDTFYRFLERQRKSPEPFGELLRRMYQQTNMLEVSFVSKLVATVNPQMPIWDKYVLRNLDLEKEWNQIRTKPVAERINKAEEIYEKICRWYQIFLDSEEGKACVAVYNEVLPEYKDIISDVKKIDYWLWSKR